MGSLDEKPVQDLKPAPMTSPLFWPLIVLAEFLETYEQEP